ncbi:MAG: GGDEF domain-containing protein, partial [Mycobacterium sp.]|nr:GGDEF domain-containing protein [Mycobacterium sp.]
GSWPSHRRSIAFIAYADIGITTVALMDADHLSGLFGINALALISLYAMFFEGPKVLALHSGWMSIALAVFGVVLATGPHGDPYLALSKSIAALASLVLTPAAVQFGIWLLRNDANDSITDHLTGLLNRRGLNLRFTGLLRKSKGTGTITVTLIDLDRFKSINDSEGHAVGDAVLVRCARRIADNVPASALVARIGGEEFVVVDVVSDREIPVLTERIRCAIAAPAEQAPVTASLGVVTVDVQTSQRRASNAETRLAAAIRCADQAMFESKGKGGNTVTVGLSEQWRTARMPVSGPVGAFGAFGADALAVGCEEIGLKGS